MVDKRGHFLFTRTSATKILLLLLLPSPAGEFFQWLQPWVTLLGKTWPSHSPLKRPLVREGAVHPQKPQNNAQNSRNYDPEATSFLVLVNPAKQTSVLHPRISLCSGTPTPLLLEENTCPPLGIYAGLCLAVVPQPAVAILLLVNRAPASLGTRFTPAQPVVST